MTADSAVDEPQRVSGLRSLLAARRRTWHLTVPIHVLAFAFLYFATDRLLQREVVSMADSMAGQVLSENAEEVRVLARIHTPELEGHLFEALSQSHADVNFRLFLASGSSIGPEAPPDETERRELAEFLSSGEVQRFKLSSADGGTHEVRGWERIVADSSCVDCHQPGKTLAIATMAMDLSEQIEQVRENSRRNLGLLILFWAAALGITSVVVKRSVARSAARIEAELAAAESGDTGPLPTASDLVFDPVSAELHESLRRFLKRRRAREAEVASRLEHTDRLASLGKLAAGLAHEIKNPLAGIQGALEILSQDLENESDRDLCGEMLGELKRVDATMQSLLSSAKPSPPRRRPTDLKQLLGDLRRLMAPGLRRRGISLEIEAPAGDIEARIDPGKIRQVLINLVNNAAESMTDGGRVNLRVGPFPDGEGAILAVEDDGPGIPEESAKRIFEPFFTTKFSGTGLGLAIARTLIEQHGGTLQFETEPGEGSTFFILLPADETAVEEASAPSEIAVAGD
jgi:signal transduction histidine kinase